MIAICDGYSKASSVHTGKLISNRNVHPRKIVHASSVSPGKPICGSNVWLSEHVSTIFFHPSKPIIGSNICSRKPVGASLFVQVNQFSVVVFVQVNLLVDMLVLVVFAQVNPLIVVMPVQVTLLVLATFILTVSASSVCSGKRICTNYVCPSKFICRSKVCQSKPTSDSNIHHKHHKPINSKHICFSNSSLSTQQISFILSLYLLAFPVYYKYSIFKIFLSIYFKLPTKLTCFRKFFILYISRRSTILCSNLHTYIVFQSFRKTLQFCIFSYSFSL